MAERITLEEARLLLWAIRTAIPQGSIWRHYKGARYRVIGVALRETDAVPMVIYVNALDTQDPAWVRPASEWLEEVTLPRGGAERRFTHIKQEIEPNGKTKET